MEYVSGPRPTQITAALAWAGLALLVYAVYVILRPFLIPLGWACVLAVFVHPAHARLARRIGKSRAAGLTTVVTAIVLIVPGVMLTIAFAREMIDMATRLQDAITGTEFVGIEQAWNALAARVPALAEVDLASVTADGLNRAATFLISEAGGTLTNLAGFFVDLLLSLFATFFILRDADSIMRAVRHLLPMEPARRERMIQRTGNLVVAGITSSAVVAGVQGLLGGIAWALVGLPSPLFWGVVMGFMCLLPFGAWIVYMPAAVVLMTTGSVGRGLILAALGLGVVSLADNVVRPVLLSERVRMNGLVIFVGLLGGLSAFGLLGIVLGPVVVATALGLLDSYVDATPHLEEGPPEGHDDFARN